MNNGTTSRIRPQQNPGALRLDDQQATDTSSGGPGDVYVLHWVRPVDVEMAEQLGIDAQALCGDWGDADAGLADEISSGRRMVRYESCSRCDEIKWGKA